ncbi:MULTISPECIES: flagellar biosynthesis protein FlhA [unclassified Oceanispirochaeta]|uniref:flagellar biosynthesis protein FlhA n=1 Tax=unclassified Oceanispirochaeta TaxID=2635722 RepID=UPI000E093704|nr:MULTISPECIES: flagellar biosynthesis protein FlhA [unclassified Oceanispirochaeta]MBF9016170.1 flagellar biosynthesis protein FlhA [Oceanispirochaeta sp. M2]NPD72632.1 flagellar biosynthesis protein FlhA [Oceanispirochaeta sp. M1]RDG31782.1 flagellar biosynthesis protein FlhA [Oceanispirochaeta sp. M1]
MALQDNIKRLLTSDNSDMLVAIGVLSVVIMLIIPLPTFMLDVLMILNLLLSVMIILIVMYSRDPLEFSVFPTMLLVATVFSLALNVSSTRLILTKGALFDGKIVKAFATFVVGSSGQEGLVVGMIIFIIIIAVQFMVITKGSTRVSEVAARFALDAMPGKQMAIEAELNSGSISEEESRKRKEHLQQSVDFYGAMDGASKFVSGNVKVSIVITVVNILGGLIVGVSLHGESFGAALATYTSLTIGDGLVSQVPALLISVATGLVVTRSISDGTFGEDVSTQFTAQARVYSIAAGFLFLLGVLPGFPWYILLPLGGLSGYTGWRLSRKHKQEAEAAEQEDKKETTEPAEMSPVVPFDPLSLELGYGLIPLVDKDQGAELLERITRIRKEAALDLGLVVPRIRIIDNMRLEPSEYCLKIKGVDVGTGVIRVDQYMAINPGGEREPLSGESTVDPAFGLSAVWIGSDQRDRAEREGYTVVDPPSIIATHLTEIIKRHAPEILGRQEVQAMLNALKEDYPAVVDEVNKTFSTGEVQKVLQNLLKEQVSIRNLVMILESMSDYGSITKDIGFLTEKVRQTLGRQICLQYATEGKELKVLTIDPSVEQSIIDARMETGKGDVAALEPEFQRAWINSVANQIRKMQESGYYPVILSSEAARPLVKSSTQRAMPDLVILSVPEVVSDIIIESVGVISLAEQA